MKVGIEDFDDAAAAGRLFVSGGTLDDEGGDGDLSHIALTSTTRGMRRRRPSVEKRFVVILDLLRVNLDLDTVFLLLVVFQAPTAHGAVEAASRAYGDETRRSTT
jgi:hypothetical protein